MDIQKSTTNRVGDAELQKWNDGGYLVIGKAFTESEKDAFNSEIDKLWLERKSESNPFVIDFWEGELFGKQMYFRDAPDDSRNLIHKLSLLYLDLDACRNMSLAPYLKQTL